VTVSSDLVETLARLVLQLEIVPTTTLSTPTTIGAPSLPVASTAGFRFGHLISFWDDAGEDPIVVDTVDAATGRLTIEPTASGRTGLTMAHDAGAVIATNLIDGPPVGEATLMLGNGWPNLYLFPLDRDDRMVGGEYDPYRNINVVIQLPGIQPGGSRMHPQLYVRTQVRRSDAIADALVGYLQRHPRMDLVDGIGHATYVETFRGTLRDAMVDNFGPVWETYLELGIHGPFQPGAFS
jgi:hypothetical protein